MPDPTDPTPPGGHDAVTLLADSLRAAGVNVGSVGGENFRQAVATRLLQEGYRLAERTPAPDPAGVAEVLTAHQSVALVSDVRGGEPFMPLRLACACDPARPFGLADDEESYAAHRAHVVAALAAAGQGTAQPAPATDAETLDAHREEWAS